MEVYTDVCNTSQRRGASRLKDVGISSCKRIRDHVGERKSWARRLPHVLKTWGYGPANVSDTILGKENPRVGRLPHVVKTFAGGPANVSQIILGNAYVLQTFPGRPIYVSRTFYARMHVEWRRSPHVLNTLVGGPANVSQTILGNNTYVLHTFPERSMDVCMLNVDVRRTSSTLSGNVW